MGPGGWLQGHGIHAGQGGQILLQSMHQFECTLDAFFRLVRVNLGQAGEAGNIFINLRIVFHRAGAERIKAVVDAEVAAGKRGIVADYIHFRYLRQDYRLAAQQSCRNQRIDAFFLRNIALRQGIGRAAGTA
ncbi:hypothetical protein D3C74_380010 [compost metagenome]